MKPFFFPNLFSMTRILLLCFLSLFVSSQLISQPTISDSSLADPDTSIRIFERVEVEASYPGGEQAWRKFLEKNLNPAVPVDNGAPCGRFTVYVQFVVNKEGKVSAIKPLTKEGYGMEQEVVRIMNKSGLWTPAIQNGRPVNAYRKQPVTFQTEQDGFNIRSKAPFVLYTNTANELTIQVDNVKDDNLEVLISQGTLINNGDGKFIARVSKPGRVLITVYSKKKKNKQIGAMSFEVYEAKSSTASSN
jgi:hypothetical protein